MGFHSTFLNNATHAIGMYVSINMGNVKVYSTFFQFGQLMIFLSVMVVMPPTTNSSKYALPNVLSIDVHRIVVLTPTNSATIYAIKLNNMQEMLRNIAGEMVMIMS